MAGDTISFGRAFGIGLLIAAVASVCYVITWEFAYVWFIPDFVDKYARPTPSATPCASQPAPQS